MPVRDWVHNDDWQSEDGSLKGSHDVNGLVHQQYVEAMLAAKLYDEKEVLKEGLLDPDCIEAREWNFLPANTNLLILPNSRVTKASLN